MTEEINNMINKFCDSVEKRISQYELEKENAELKSYSQRMENQRENYYKEYLRLEQENKELKEKKDKYYQQTLDDEILINELSLEVDLRKKESDFYLEKLSKYRSALEEIRNLVRGHKVADEIRLKSILDKINEVLNPS